MQTTTYTTAPRTAAQLHADILAAAAVAPDFQNNDLSLASHMVATATQLRAVYFDDGLIDRIQYAQRMGWRESQGEWLIESTMDETYSELAAMCDQRPRHVTFKTATGRIKLVNTTDRLQGFADAMAKNKAAWQLWGGGAMPAELAKPKKAKPATTWQTTAINVCVQLFEDTNYADGLAMALDRLGGRAYWHKQNPKNEPFLMIAPQPVAGLPDRLVSGRHAIGGDWAVYDTVSGYAIGANAKHRSRAAAERMAADLLSEKTPEQVDKAFSQATACNTAEALARLRALWQLNDTAEALAAAQATAEAQAAEAEAEAVAQAEAQAAEAVAAVVADALAAAAIDAAQAAARGAELAAVADVASAGQDVATPAADALAEAQAAAEDDAEACTADAVADATEAQASTAAPGHTATPRAMASTAGAQPGGAGTPGSTGTARSAGTPGQGGGRGQVVAGKSGRWVATFHTTAAGLPGMLYTGPDGVASAHEFDTGSQRMAALQRMARAADATPPATPGQASAGSQAAAEADAVAAAAQAQADAMQRATPGTTEADTGHAMATDARLQHLARAFDPAGVDVWQCAAHELQDLPPADYVALLQHLENINHHTAHLAAQCKRAGRVDLARVCEKIERAHLAAGQLTCPLRLARQAVANILSGRVDATSQATEWGEALAAAQAQAEADAVAAAAKAQADAMQCATPGTTEADTGHATQAQAAQACAPAASAYPQANSPTAPYTPPAAAAAAQATPPVCAADATDYTDPLKTLGTDYTDPLETLGALSITITRGEGPTIECGKPRTVDSFDAADAVLHAWSSTAPENGGYDKCDFVITWPDGDTYSGRYDLKHYRTERPSLARHMVDMVDFYTGKGCPAHMSEAAYANFLNRVDADTRQAYEATSQRLNAAGIHTGKARPVSVDLRELVAMGMPVADLVGLGVTYCGDHYTEPKTGAIVEAEAVAMNSGVYRVGLMGNPGPAELAKVAQIRVIVQTEDGSTLTAWHDDFSGRTGARYRLDMKRHGAPYLAQLAAAVAMRTAQATAAKELEAKAHADELARLAVEFAHLERANGNGGGVFAARNIRTELKRAFPGVKFSVKSDYSSVDVRWTDGPTDAQVSDVIGRFDIGASDSQSDYFYTVRTAFSELFGGVQYLNTHRDTSDELTAEAISEFWAANFADAPAMPTPADWRNATGFFDWRADNWQTRNFRDHLAAKAGPLPAAKTTRKAKA